MKFAKLGAMKILCNLLFMVMLGLTSLQAADSVHEITSKDIDGEELALKDFKGKLILFVNVASQCGSTNQYEGMQRLWQAGQEAGLVVIGVPTNDFGGQEPGTDAEIKEFCSANYQVSFPMLAKQSAKGDDQSALFKFFASAENPDEKGEVGWNFEKFLVGPDGKLLRRFPTHEEPDGPAIVEVIQAELAKLPQNQLEEKAE